MNYFQYKLVELVTNDYLVKLKTELTPLIWGELTSVTVHKTFYVPSTPDNKELLINTSIVATVDKIQPSTYKVALLVYNPKVCYETRVPCNYLSKLEPFFT